MKLLLQFIVLMVLSSWQSLVYAETDCSVVTEIPTAQCEALVALYNSTDGDNWKDNTGWKQTNTPCSWFGVICSGGSSIFNISMSNNQLTGSIPDLSALINLRHIFLSNNQLTGSIPNFNRSDKLINLYLQDNQFTGSIPDFNALTNLEDLRLNNNQLTGSIPNFSTLANLRILYLNNNQLTGFIPDFSLLTNLLVLVLNDNQLTGSIPKLNDFNHLNLSNNFQLCRNQNIDYTGRPEVDVFPLCETTFSCNTVTEIPKNQCEALVALYDSTDGDNWKTNTGWKDTNTPCSWYGILCSADGEVTRVSLLNNQLNGAIPDINALTELQILYLYGNNITGSLPEFNSISKIQRIRLDRNQLTGSIPNFDNMPKLQELMLNNNKFTGEIPNFSNLPSLLHLYLASNQLTDSIPNFNMLTNLKFLVLGNNQFSGSTPTFNLLVNLENINLGGNQLTGSVPEFSTLTKLKTLNLRNNKLTGSIPEFNSLTQLRFLDLQENQLSGSVPRFNVLANLVQLMLSNNKLASIQKFGDLTKLELLELENNQLISSIPDLSNLTGLRQIRMRNNQLTGSIPNLDNLTNLQHILLSNNQLTGTIPSLSTLTKLVYLHLDNNQLDGAIPDLSMLTRLRFLQLSDNEICRNPDADYAGHSEVDAFPVCEATFSCDTVTKIPKNQCEALVALYDNTDGDNWTNNNNWKQTNTPCFDWYGVNCTSDSNVSQISMPRNQLKGFIPDLSALTGLQVFYLYDNQLSGTIPDLSSLINLHSVKLHRNQLSGTINSFSTLISLKLLYIYNNQFTGTVSDFSESTNLEVLILHSNQFTGSVPNFNALNKLNKINLSNNQLNGFIPNFNNLTNLEFLDLNGNQLTGSVPDFNKLYNLTSIYLQNNQLSGSIPNFSTLTNVIRYLYLDRNQLTGSITNLNSLSNLQYLGLSTNKLIGNISDLSNLTNLKSLIINNNQFTGLIPDLSIFSNLQTISIENNLFCKDNNINYGEWTTKINNFPNCTTIFSCNNVTEIPTNQCEALVALYDNTDGDNWTDNTGWKQTNTPCSWGDKENTIMCTGAGDVTNISMYNNNLNGTLPDLSALTELLYVALSNNQLTGSIPDLSAFTKLHTLGVNGNQLTGNIPDLSNLTQLKTLYLYSNQLSGTIPDLSTLTNLEDIRLYNNQLTGSIPDLTNSTKLRNLQLASNNLTGNLPDFSTFTNLEHVWLSNNQLTGTIPNLDGLTKLTYFHVWDNQLTGTIPNISNLTQLEKLDLGKNQLTGGIPELKTLTNIQRLNLAGNKLEGAIPDLLASWSELYINGNTSLCRDSEANYTGRTEVDEYPACNSVFSCNKVTEIPRNQCEALVSIYNSTDGDNWTNNTGWKQTNNPCTSWYNVACKDGNVTDIALENNNLSGVIPSLSSLTGLETLPIGNNPGITGNFPDISQLSKLEHISIGQTNITGTLPTNIVNATSLQELGISETKLSGELPDFSKLTNLKVLNLGNSKLTGEIPALPSGLTSLNLTGNSLCRNPNTNYGYTEIEALPICGEQPPEPVIAEPIIEGNTVTLDASNSIDPDPNGEITGYIWTTDEGKTETGVNPTIEFATEGEHTVTLITVDNTGLISDKVEQQVTIGPEIPDVPQNDEEPPAEGADRPPEPDPQPVEATSLTINKRGTGTGSISLNDSIKCAKICGRHVENYETSTEVKLQVVPSPDSIFIGWNRNCGNTTDLITTVTVDKKLKCIAYFELDPTKQHLHRVNAIKIGHGYGDIVVKTSNGVVTDICSSPTCVAKFYATDTEITLTARNRSKSTFVGWGEDCAVGGDNETITVTIDKATNCTAQFDLKPPIAGQYILTVDIGQNTMSPSGGYVVSGSNINCGYDCKEIYNQDSAVKLIAVPDSHSYFVRWEDNCEGIRAGIKIVMDANKTCTAIFGSNSDLSAELIAEEFMNIGELVNYAGENYRLNDMFPSIYNETCYQEAYRLAENAMQTVEEQYTITGTWPIHFMPLDTWFKPSPEYFCTKNIRIVSGEDEIGGDIVKGEFIQVDVELTNADQELEDVSILVYYDVEPTITPALTRARCCRRKCRHRRHRRRR